jgi:hypothetical protein
VEKLVDTVKGFSLLIADFCYYLPIFGLIMIAGLTCFWNVIIDLVGKYGVNYLLILFGGYDFLVE